MIIRSAFAKNLILVRRKHGITQKELAKMVNSSPRMIAYYETHAKNPPLEKIKLIASVLNISIDELLKNNDVVSKNKNITEIETSDMIDSLDIKTIKYIKMLISLNATDRFIVYRLIDSLLNKTKSKSPQ